MSLREGLRLAAVDRRADVEHHQILVVQMSVEPGRADQRLRIGGGRRGEHKREREGGGKPVSVAAKRRANFFLMARVRSK